MKIEYMGGGEYRAIGEKREFTIGITEAGPQLLAMSPACDCQCECEDDCGVDDALGAVAMRHAERTGTQEMF